MYAFYCNICNKSVSCEHMGEADVSRHVDSEMHRKNLRGRRESAHLKQVSLSSMFQAGNELTPVEFKARRSEVKFAMFLAEHHIPIAAMDHLSPLVKECFPDSKIASSFACRRTKTSCIINDAIAPSLLLSVTTALASSPFSLSVDGSNDSGLKKMNPLAVKIFDVQRQKVMFNLIDMCTTAGEKAATAEAIVSSIIGVFQKLSLPWMNVVAISMDNTSVNFGKRKGILTQLKKESCPHIYGMGCPCHIIHNMAEKGYKAFSVASGFDIEELAVDVCYWFDKSTKRKASLESFSTFCDIEYKQMLDFCSTRWLCMHAVVKRMIDMYEPLRSYFTSSAPDEKGGRLNRLIKAFSDPLTIIHLHFFNHALPVFDDLNLLLQRQDPQIHRLKSSMDRFIVKVLTRIMDATEVSLLDNIWACDLDSVSLLPDNEVNIGTLAEQGLESLFESGDIGSSQKTKFLSAVKCFWTAVYTYAVDKLPFNDEVIINSKWVNFTQRHEAKFSQVKFFVNKFPVLALTSPQIDTLREEFDDYKSMKETEIKLDSCTIDIQYKDISNVFG